MANRKRSLSATVRTTWEQRATRGSFAKPASRDKEKDYRAVATQKIARALQRPSSDCDACSCGSPKSRSKRKDTLKSTCQSTVRAISAKLKARCGGASRAPAAETHPVQTDDDEVLHFAQPLQRVHETLKVARDLVGHGESCEQVTSASHSTTRTRACWRTCAHAQPQRAMLPQQQTHRRQAGTSSKVVRLKQRT